MRIIEIVALPNGAHRNQNSNLSKVPDGWAMIPEDMELENFPFGEVTAEDIENASGELVMTVTDWVPGVLPEPEEEKAAASAQDDIDTMLIDHEYRLTLLELGRTE